MPVDPGDLTKLRARPQAQDFYLAVLHPVTVWTGQVNGSPDRGAISIPFDNATELTAPEEHFTLWVGSPGITGEGEDDVGVLRFRSKTANTMKVGSNDITWADNQNLTIKREVRPWAVLPNLENTLEDSDKVYSDENINQHPLGRIGPPGCAILEDGTATVNFWSDSIATANGANLTVHAWIFDGGSPGSSAIAGTSDVPIAVTYTTPGQKWVKYTVTDDNGKTHVRYSMVYVFNTTTDIAISGFNVDSLVGDLESGVWRASITVTQDCNITEFPEMAQVVIFNKAYWNGTQVDVGYGWKHRENISFVGYIVKDSVRKNAETGNTTFEVTSTVSIMKNLTCWGASLKNSGTAGWHVIPNMTLNLAAFHVFTEHTTLDHIADIYLNLDIITMAYIDFQEGSPYDHVKTQIGEAGRSILANNKFGQIYLEPNAQLSKVADRPVDVLFDMVHGDWRDEITLGEERDIENICQVDFIGFLYSGTDPVPYGSLAPGRQWSTGGVQKVTGVRVTGQSEANTYAGLFEGNFNNEFDNVVVPMAGFWPVFDIVPQAYVRITLVAADTNRELEWSLVKHLPAQVVVNINNEGGYVLTDVTFRQYAYGSPGIDNEIPSEPTPPDPDPPPEPPDPDPKIPDLPPQAALAYNQYHIGYTPDMLLHHVASTATGGSGTTLDDTTVDFVELLVAVDDLIENMTTYARTRVAAVVNTTRITLDADIGLTANCEYHICGAQWSKVGDYTADFNGETIYQVEEVQTGASSIGAWVLTSGGVYWAANILTTSPSWSCKLTLTQLRTDLGYVSPKGKFRGIETHVSNPSFAIVHFDSEKLGVASTHGCVYTNNTGGSWTYSIFPSHRGACPFFGIEIDISSGTIFVIRSPWGTNAGKIYVSGDGGANFAVKTGFINTWVIQDTRADLYRPYGGSGLYVEVRQSNTSPGKSSDDGDTWVLLTATGYSDPGLVSHGITGHYADDNDIIANWKADDDNHIVMLRSTDGGGSWTEIADAVVLFQKVVNQATAVAAETWPADSDIIVWVCRWSIISDINYLGASAIRYTNDGGITWYDMMGNWYLNTDFHFLDDPGGDWAGSCGSSACSGTVGVILFPRAGDNA